VYVEADLAEMAARKRRLLEESGLFTPGHEVCPLARLGSCSGVIAVVWGMFEFRLLCSLYIKRTRWLLLTPPSLYM